MLSRLVKGFSHRHQPRSHAADLVESIHVLLRLLERLSSQGESLTVAHPMPISVHTCCYAGLSVKSRATGAVAAGALLVHPGCGSVSDPVSSLKASADSTFCFCPAPGMVTVAVTWCTVRSCSPIPRQAQGTHWDEAASQATS